MDAPHLPPPQQEQHMDDVFSATCVGELWRGVHKCARVSVSVVHGVHSVQNVLSPDGGFQRVFCEVCAHLQNVSDSVAELDAPRNPFDDSDELCACQEKTAPDRISARGAKAKPAPNPGAFSVRGRPGADLAGFGQIWRPGGYSN